MFPALELELWHDLGFLPSRKVTSRWIYSGFSFPSHRVGQSNGLNPKDAFGLVVLLGLPPKLSKRLPNLRLVEAAV